MNDADTIHSMGSIAISAPIMSSAYSTTCDTRACAREQRPKPRPLAEPPAVVSRSRRSTSIGATLDVLLLQPELNQRREQDHDEQHERDRRGVPHPPPAEPFLVH